MKELVILLSIITFPTVAEIGQGTWLLAHKNDSVAQYAVANAYNPYSISHEDAWYCGNIDEFYIYTEEDDRKCREKSPENYIRWLSKSASNHYPLAQTQLGIEFLKGQNVDKNITNAIYWLTKAANPVPKNIQFAVGEGTLWLRDGALNHGVGEAQYFLGWIYQTEKNDTNKAIEYYQKSANSMDWGNTNLAQYQLAKLYEQKLNNPQKAIFWLEKASSNMKVLSNPQTRHIPLEVVNYYLSGYQKDNSKSEQIDYLRAAKQLLVMLKQDWLPKNDLLEANFLLAWLYLNGDGVLKDSAIAAKYYRLGLGRFYTQDNKIPFTFMGNRLQNEFMNSVIAPLFENKLNLDQASMTLSQVFNGNTEQERMFLEAFILELNQSDFDNKTKTFKHGLYELAQNRNHAIGYYMTAQEKLMSYTQLVTNRRYYRDDSLAKEIEALYLKALSLNTTDSSTNYSLAVYYDLVLDSPEKAIEYYKKAIEYSNELASYRLGVLYYLGRGVSQDYKQAWQLLQKSASLGYKPAQNFIINVMSTHTDAEWLKAKYIEFDQSYPSPVVMIDGIDWLKDQSDKKTNIMTQYHYAKRINGENFYRNCDLAKQYAQSGNIPTQEKLVSLMKSGNTGCLPKEDDIMVWIENSQHSSLDKMYLRGLYYHATNRKEKAIEIMNTLIGSNYADAYVYLAKNDHYNKKSDKKSANDYIAIALKQGNAQAAELLIGKFYRTIDKNAADNYQYQKMILIRNDLINFYSNDYIDLYSPKLRESQYIYSISLSKADIFKMWNEIAVMHELGNDLPQNLKLAYVWFNLLRDHNQIIDSEKIDEIRQQLSEDELRRAEKILAKHRDVYRFFTITNE